jgi:pyrroloquinoline quinone (PQQ) biosynthesis protein C
VLGVMADGMALPRYQRFLLELYHIVWYFNPICAAAASRVTDTHRAVRLHLYRHMEEEKGHEDWVLQDMLALALGLTEGEVRGRSPGVHTSALVGFNYFGADRGHPCSVLGMLYALEVIASVYGAPFSNVIRERLLIDGDRGVSFIESHATLDAEHMAELREVLLALDDAPSQDAVVVSACVNFHHFTQILASA